MLAKGVTKVDTEALLMYQGIYYKEINEHLRTGTTISPHAAEAVKRLDKMIAKSALGNDTILYRGFGLKNQMAVGDTFNDKGFLSMSRDNTVGRSFAFGTNDPYKYLLRVKVPQGYHGLDVNATLLERSGYPYEGFVAHCCGECNFLAQALLLESDYTLKPLRSLFPA